MIGSAPCRSPDRSPRRSRPSSRPSPRSPRPGSSGRRGPTGCCNTAVALVRWGPTPAAGYTAAAARYPDDVGDRRRARHAHLQAGPRAHQRARPRAAQGRRRRRGRRRGDHVPQPPRLHRDRRGVLEARRQRPVPQHGVLQAAADRRARARGARRARLRRRSSPSCSSDADVELKRYIAWHEPDDEARRPAPRGRSIEGGDTTNLTPPKEPGKATILTSGTTGTPKGASRSQPKSMDPIAALLDRIPLKARETTMIAAPLFHSWGYAHWSLGIALASTRRAQAQVRPRGDAVADRPAPGHRARRRAGDDPADPRARRRGARALRPVGAARRSRSPAPRCPARSPTAGWTCSARTSTTSTARPRSRGRRSPRRRTCARRPAPPASRRAARRQALRRRRQAGRAGRDRPHLRRQRGAVRGLHRRRQQGRHRRA